MIKYSSGGLWRHCSKQRLCFNWYSVVYCVYIMYRMCTWNEKDWQGIMLPKWKHSGIIKTLRVLFADAHSWKKHLFWGGKYKLIVCCMDRTLCRFSSCFLARVCSIEDSHLMEITQGLDTGRKSAFLGHSVFKCHQLYQLMCEKSNYLESRLR